MLLENLPLLATSDDAVARQFYRFTFSSCFTIASYLLTTFVRRLSSLNNISVNSLKDAKDRTHASRWYDIIRDNPESAEFRTRARQVHWHNIFLGDIPRRLWVFLDCDCEGIHRALWPNFMPHFVFSRCIIVHCPPTTTKAPQNRHSKKD